MPMAERARRETYSRFGRISSKSLLRSPERMVALVACLVLRRYCEAAAMSRSMAPAVCQRRLRSFSRKLTLLAPNRVG